MWWVREARSWEIKWRPCPCYARRSVGKRKSQIITIEGNLEFPFFNITSKEEILWSSRSHSSTLSWSTTNQVNTCLLNVLEKCPDPHSPTTKQQSTSIVSILFLACRNWGHVLAATRHQLNLTSPQPSRASLGDLLFWFPVLALTWPNFLTCSSYNVI